jgi:tRNA pseudouridine38-40 synthase
MAEGGAPEAHEARPLTVLAALVAYDGTDFKGFQRQSAERGRTVQGVIERASERVAGEAVPVVGAGRTDTGVHASGQVISFASRARLDLGAWQRALNANLPPDVAVRGVAMVAPEFHARRSALARRYRYRILVDPVRAPLAERYAWRVAYPLDVATMAAATALLVGEHDFSAFGSSPRDRPGEGYRGHTVRKMLEASVHCVHGGDERRAGGSQIELRFAANAFLTGMVRRLVGTLALVGAGRLSLAEFVAILESRDKAHRGVAAPACGLCLTRVDYPADVLAW